MRRRDRLEIVSFPSIVFCCNVQVRTHTLRYLKTTKNQEKLQRYKNTTETSCRDRCYDIIKMYLTGLTNYRHVSSIVPLKIDRYRYTNYTQYISAYDAA